MDGTKLAAWPDRPIVRAGMGAAGGAVLALLVVGFARFGADWPAQDFRAELARHGLSVWTNAWYGGSALPGYSVLYPFAALALGSSGTGVVSVAAVVGLAVLLGPSSRWRALAFAAAVAVCALESLLIGQVPFLLGVAFGAAALLAVRSSRPTWAVLSAAACSLASPLPGLFLLLAAAALVRSCGWRRAGLLAPAALGSAVTLVVDAGGGPFTYHFPTLRAIAIFATFVLVLTTRRERAWRDLAVVYVLVAAALFVVANPVGTNIGRLGKIAALPLAVLYLSTVPLPRWRQVGVVLGAALAAWWSVLPVLTAVQYGAHDPGRSASYYRGLLGFLRTQNPVAGRLEIPFTRTHTETDRVATVFPLARGWERQDDLADNEVLYHPLTATTYRRWLDDNAVSLVALPTLHPDLGGQAEASLLRDPPSYLRLVYRDRDWQVWRVTAPQPLASGAATLTALGPASLRLRFTRAGTSEVRVRASPLWEVTAGSASLRRASGGWLEVTAPAAGSVTLRARLNLSVLDPSNPLR